MYHYHIDPNVLNEDDWIKAYVGIKEIIKEKQRVNKQR
jgi:hypothetical protein